MANDGRLRKFVLAACRNYIRQKSDGWAVDPNGLVWYEAYAGGFKSSDEAIGDTIKFTVVCGTMTTNGAGYNIAVDVEYTDV